MVYQNQLRQLFQSNVINFVTTLKSLKFQYVFQQVPQFMQTMACIMPHILQKICLSLNPVTVKQTYTLIFIVNSLNLWATQFLPKVFYSHLSYSYFSASSNPALPSWTIFVLSPFSYESTDQIFQQQMLFLTFSSSSLANSHLSTVTYVNLKIWWCLKSFCHSETSGNHFTLFQGPHLTTVLHSKATFLL